MNGLDKILDSLIPDIVSDVYMFPTIEQLVGGFIALILASGYIMKRMGYLRGNKNSDYTHESTKETKDRDPPDSIHCPDPECQKSVHDTSNTLLMVQNIQQKQLEKLDNIAAAVNEITGWMKHNGYVK